jgi:hypothetical protein
MMLGSSSKIKAGALLLQKPMTLAQRGSAASNCTNAWPKAPLDPKTTARKLCGKAVIACDTATKA